MPCGYRDAGSRQPCANRGRDWDEAKKHLGETPEPGRGRKHYPEHGPDLVDLRLLAFRSVRHTFLGLKPPHNKV